MTQQDASSTFSAVVRMSVRLGVIFVFVAGVLVALDWSLAMAEGRGGDMMMLSVLVVLVLLYIFLMALPFVPGIEIGISLLFLKGAAIAPVVYLATVAGLSLALLAGRWLPYGWLRNALLDFRLTPAAGLIERLAPLDGAQRLAILSRQLPDWLAPLVGPWRYLVLAVLFNLPGNAFLGGGGGIAFAAGFSRLFHTGVAILVIALAVSPVPLSVWLTGETTVQP